MSHTEAQGLQKTAYNILTT